VTGPKPPEGAEDWPGGVKPGIGAGDELDRALEKGNRDADPATRSPLPGLTGEPDATEAGIEGEGISRARDAIEDLPRQG